MTDEPTDFDLVVAATSGDRVSIERLLERHCPKLLALARHISAPTAPRT
jgi:hypothetical protein